LFACASVRSACMCVCLCACMCVRMCVHACAHMYARKFYVFLMYVCYVPCMRPKRVFLVSTYANTHANNRLISDRDFGRRGSAAIREAIRYLDGHLQAPSLLLQKPKHPCSRSQSHKANISYAALETGPANAVVAQMSHIHAARSAAAASG